MVEFLYAVTADQKGPSGCCSAATSDPAVAHTFPSVNPASDSDEQTDHLSCATCPVSALSSICSIYD